MVPSLWCKTEVVNHGQDSKSSNSYDGCECVVFACLKFQNDNDDNGSKYLLKMVVDL